MRSNLAMLMLLIVGATGCGLPVCASGWFEAGSQNDPEGKEGLHWLPDGDLVYDRSIHRFTTLPMQAAEIHEIGMQQIARLADEYRELGAEVLGTTDLQEIFSRLRDDPALHHTTGEDKPDGSLRQETDRECEVSDECPNPTA